MKGMNVCISTFMSDMNKYVTNICVENNQN